MKKKFFLYKILKNKYINNWYTPIDSFYVVLAH